MKRGGPLKRRTPLKAKRTLKPITLDDVKSAWKKLIAPVNRVRAAKRKLDAFGPPGFVEFVHGRGCIVARESGAMGGCLGPTEVAHVRSRATGGSWRDCVGLCLGHHRESHTIGQQTFAKKYGLDMELWADATVHQFERERDGW